MKLALLALTTILLVARAPEARADNETVATAAPEKRVAAQRTFEAGDGLYQSKRFEDALTAFRTSYDLVASPNSRLMIARSLRELGRVTEAESEFRAAIAEAEASGERYEETAAAARADLAALEANVARLTIVVEEGSAEIEVGGRLLAPDEIGREILLQPGTIAVHATFQSGDRQELQVPMAPGAKQVVKLRARRAEQQGSAASSSTPPSAQAPATAPRKPEPGRPPRASEASGPPRALAYTALGVGAAGIAGFTVFGLMSRSAHQELEQSCTNDTCPPDRADQIEDGRTYQTLANVGLALGVLGVGTGITLFVLSEPGGEQTSARLGPGSLELTGRF